MQFSLNGGGLGRNAYVGPKRRKVACLLDNFLNCDMCICVFVFSCVWTGNARIHWSEETQSGMFP